MYLILEAYACSDVGVERPGNEDNLYFNGLIKDEAAESFKHYEKMNIKKSRAVFGVFDGMGGYAKGEHASYITADTAKSFLKENRKGDPKEILHKICSDSNAKVCEEIKKDEGQRMGSTLAMLYFEGTSYHLCNVGDSPIYMMRKGELKKIYFEHTEAATYIKIYGEAPPKDKKFPLTQHIGMSDAPDRLKPYYITDTVKEGDIFLICSDGLTDMLDDAELTRVINSSRPLTGIGTILLNNALERGGKDNISFVLIKATDVGEPKPESIKSRSNITVSPQKDKNVNNTDTANKKESENIKNNKASPNQNKHNVKENDEEKIAERKAIFNIAVGIIGFVAACAAAVWYILASQDLINRIK